jgi:hypothetical protein
MNRIITFAVSEDDGMVYSRVGNEVAYPVLQWEKIGEGGDYTQPLEYELEKSSVFSLVDYWPRLKWTRKIPTELKNRHRAFLGMKELAI